MRVARRLEVDHVMLRGDMSDPLGAMLSDLGLANMYRADRRASGSPRWWTLAAAPRFWGRGRLLFKGPQNETMPKENHGLTLIEGISPLLAPGFCGAGESGIFCWVSAEAENWRKEGLMPARLLAAGAMLLIPYIPRSPGMNPDATLLLMLIFWQFSSPGLT